MNCHWCYFNDKHTVERHDEKFLTHGWIHFYREKDTKKFMQGSFNLQLSILKNIDGIGHKHPVKMDTWVKNGLLIRSYIVEPQKARGGLGRYT